MHVHTVHENVHTTLLFYSNRHTPENMKLHENFRIGSLLGQFDFLDIY